MHIQIKNFLPMSCWSYEVKTAVYSRVNNVTSIEARLILKITLKLVIHIIQNWFETEKEIATFSGLEINTCKLTKCELAFDNLQVRKISTNKCLQVNHPYLPNIWKEFASDLTSLLACGNNL